MHEELEESGAVRQQRARQRALRETTLERERSALRAVHDAYPKYLVTTDRRHVGSTEDGIRIVNVVDWVLEA